MRKTTMMVSRKSLDAPLARTFGKAKWLLIYQDGTHFEFQRNVTLSGGSVAAAISAAGARDVIVACMGAKAHRHLEELRIRAWDGPAGVPVRSVIQMHERGELPPWSPDAAARIPGCSAGGRPHAHRGHAEGGGAPEEPMVQLRRPHPADPSSPHVRAGHLTKETS